jgi:hypothetical protein
MMPYIRRMRRFGQFLMGLGAAVGTAFALAMLAHVGWNGVPWFINVALAKFGLATAGGLMAGGAVSIRIANRRDRSNLLPGQR